jgi:hypothetical protein
MGWCHGRFQQTDTRVGFMRYIGLCLGLFLLSAMANAQTPSNQTQQSLTIAENTAMPMNIRMLWSQSAMSVFSPVVVLVGLILDDFANKKRCLAIPSLTVLSLGVLGHLSALIVSVVNLPMLMNDPALVSRTPL